MSWKCYGQSQSQLGHSSGGSNGAHTSGTLHLYVDPTAAPQLKPLCEKLFYAPA